MSSQFEIGGRYRNRKGVYKVLAFEGEKMRVRYDDGSEQSLSIERAAWIWQSILDEEGPPLETHYPGQDSQSIQPVIDLVDEVLKTSFKAPFPGDITDQVCLAIEANPEWQKRYDDLVQHYNSGGKDGKSLVNSSIGYYTKDLTGMVNIGEGKTAKSSLIGSYSRLGYPELPASG